MAKVIAELPKRTRESKYDWDTFLDGQARELTKDEDFPTATVGSFSNLARQTAKERGLAVSIITVDEDTVALQASVVTEDAPTEA